MISFCLFSNIADPCEHFRLGTLLEYQSSLFSPVIKVAFSVI